MSFILIIVFLAIVGVLYGGFLFVNRNRLSAAERARGRLRRAETSDSTISIMKDEKVSDLAALDRMLTDRSVVEVLSVQLARAGSTLKPGAFLINMALCAVAGFLVARMLNFGAFSFFGVLIGAGAPIFWLKRKQSKRMNKFQSQLPDAIDMLVNAMRAGYSFQAAMRFIGEETVDPLGGEFTRFYEEQRLGVEVKQALLNLQERMGSTDLQMLVTAIIIQRETGGNLSEVLSNISGVMRERDAMRGEFETLTAESKLSARILAALPVIMYFMLTLIRPQYTDVLTGTTAGQIMLAFAAVIVTVGYFTMMNIANIDI